MLYLFSHHKIDGTTTDDAEDLDLLMMLYNILETIRIILMRHVVYGFIPKMKQLILLLILQTLVFLSLSIIRLN